MWRTPILLVFVGCASTTPAPLPLVTVASSPVAEPCPEPEPEPDRVVAPRYATRVIGAEARGARYGGRPIDLDLKDADIGNVCRLLADVGKVNIVLGDGVQGRVTLSMKRVPWDQALDAVIEAKGLRAEREGNVILVYAK